MQDDAHLIAADAWVARPARIVETDKKGKRKDKGWACDLIPKPLIVARYFAKEQAAIDQLFTEQENIDDVIFFPLMRPAVSPFNAQIYGIEDRAIEPVQDLAITIEEAKDLIQSDALKPLGNPASASKRLAALGS